MKARRETTGCTVVATEIDTQEFLRKEGVGACAQAYQIAREFVRMNRVRFLPSIEYMDRYGDQVHAMNAREEAIRNGVLGRILQAVAERTDDEQLVEVAVAQRDLSTYLAREGFSMRTMLPAWKAAGWILTNGQDNRCKIPVRLAGTLTACICLVM